MVNEKALETATKTKLSQLCAQQIVQNIVENL